MLSISQTFPKVSRRLVQLPPLYTKFKFVTCHSHFDSSLRLQICQSRTSRLDEYNMHSSSEQSRYPTVFCQYQDNKIKTIIKSFYLFFNFYKKILFFSIDIYRSIEYSLFQNERNNDRFGQMLIFQERSTHYIFDGLW